MRETHKYTALAVIAIVFAPLSVSEIQNQPDDGQWIMPAKNFASTRYSTLAQIDATNVKNLKLVGSFSTGLTKGHEAAPLVVNDTMYVVTPWAEPTQRNQ